MSSNIEELKRRMEGALSALSHDFQGLRTGRASVSLLDGIQVEAYGSFMPLNQMASVSAEPPDIDRPTTALPVGCTPRLAASQAGSSWVRNVSHL